MSGVNINDSNPEDNLDLEEILRNSQQEWQAEINKLLKGLLSRLDDSEQRRCDEKKEAVIQARIAADEIRDLRRKNRQFEDNIQELYDELEQGYVSKRNFNDFQEQVRTMQERNSGPARVNTTQRPKPLMRVHPPTFEDRSNEKPMKFLREINEYCAVTQAEPGEARYIVSQALRGTAGEWWRLVQDEIQDWTDFERRFTLKFWNDTRQSAIKKEMEYGCYNPNERMSRSEYAMKFFGLAKELTIQPSESAVISQIANHFNEEIRSAIFSREIVTRDRLLQMLERFDNAGDLNKQRNLVHNRESKSYETRNNQEGYRRDDRKWEQHKKPEVSNYGNRPNYRLNEGNRGNFNTEKESRPRNRDERINRPEDNRYGRDNVKVNIVEMRHKSNENLADREVTVTEKEGDQRSITHEQNTGQGN